MGQPTTTTTRQQHEQRPLPFLHRPNLHRAALARRHRATPHCSRLCRRRRAALQLSPLCIRAFQCRGATRPDLCRRHHNHNGNSVPPVPSPCDPDLWRRIGHRQPARRHPRTSTYRCRCHNSSTTAAVSHRFLHNHHRLRPTTAAPSTRGSRIPPTTRKAVAGGRSDPAPAVPPLSTRRPSRAPDDEERPPRTVAAVVAAEVAAAFDCARHTAVVEPSLDRRRREGRPIVALGVQWTGSPPSEKGVEVEFFPPVGITGAGAKTASLNTPGSVVAFWTVRLSASGECNFTASQGPILSTHIVARWSLSHSLDLSRLQTCLGPRARSTASGFSRTCASASIIPTRSSTTSS